MARTIELKKTKMLSLPKSRSDGGQIADTQGLGEHELGQISIGPLTLAGTAKARISWKFLPDLTVDLNAPKTTGFSIMDILKPNITVLLGGAAYKIDPYATDGSTLTNVDTTIFDTPTFLDKMANMGMIPIAGIIVGVGYFGYKLMKWYSNKSAGHIVED